MNEADSVHYPKLYTPGHYNMLFNKRVFARSVAEGIVSSLVLFFVPYFAFYDAVKPDGLEIAGHKAFGCVVASALIVTVTLRVRTAPVLLLSAFTLLCLQCFDTARLMSGRASGL